MKIKNKRKYLLFVSIVMMIVIVILFNACSLNRTMRPLQVANSIVQEGEYDNATLFEKVATNNIGGVARIQSQYGRGTAFLIDAKNGVLLTNAHVVCDESYNYGMGVVDLFFLQASKDGKVSTQELKVKGKVLVIAKNTDLALVQIDKSLSTNIGELKFETSLDSLNYGRPAIFIGNPENIGISVGKAIIANPNYAMQIKWDIISKTTFMYIQIDGNVNHGNSGGPLINARGKVIGIVSLRREANTARQEPIVQGVGFALRFDEMKESITGMYDYYNNKYSSSKLSRENF